MTARLDSLELLQREEIVAPPLPRACTDRSFELPPVLHVTTGILFLGFVTVLCAAFATAELLVPYGVFVALIVAFFTVPGLWARMKPEESRTRALSWYEFREKGIDTATGRTGAGEATVLVLTLPVLILCWAIAVATIAAVVR
ncbi:MAG TPA: hypothetical protein VM308_07770 [Sphingomicrobium sp.]|nr:hypothetical protein [Sphingomicrobium sp.]